MMMADALKVNQHSRSSAKLNENVEMLSALLSGTKAMRAAKTKYLPQWPNEEDPAYKTRCETATLFPCYERTVDVLSSRPFSEPVTIEDKSPARFKDELSKDVDNEGSSIDQFAQRLLAHALGHGFAGILVDAPPPVKPSTAAGVATQADEKKAGVRPYLCLLKAESILGWRFDQVAGKYKFTQLRFMETVTEPDGEWGDVEVKQVRVLEPNKWRTFRERASADGASKSWVEHESGTTDLDYVPFVPVYGKYIGFMQSEPPLLNLAHLNIKHWQSQSDQDTILHFARVPILCAVGGDEKTKIVIGGQSAVVVPMSGDLKFVEHTGAAVEAGQKSLEALEQQQRQAGAELLVIRPGQVTATQVWSENEGGMSSLQRIVINLQVSINLALHYMSEMAGETSDAAVKIFSDFGVQSLDQASAELVFKMGTAGKLSDESTFEEMKRRGILSGERNWEDEQKRLEDQGPAFGEIGEDEEVEMGPDGQPVLDPATGAPKMKKRVMPDAPLPGRPPQFGGGR